MFRDLFTGRSEVGSKSGKQSSSSSSRGLERKKSSSRKAESVVSSSSRRDEDDADRRRRRRSNTIDTESSTSRYVTAPSSRVAEPPRRSLTESALAQVPVDEDDWEDDDIDARSERRSRRGGDDTDVKRRKSKTEKERRRSSSRERKSSTRKSSEVPSTITGRTTRAIDDTRESSRAIPEMGSFEQFPGQYDGGFVGPPSQQQDVYMSGALPAPTPAQQFPQQIPAEHERPPPMLGPRRGESFGEAAEYYMDQGESVAHQPGLRPHTPNMLVNADPHLMSASAEANPAQDTGNGTAAEFYSGAVEMPSSAPTSASKPTKPSKPGKTSSSGSAGLLAAAAVAGAALGSASHGQTNHQQNNTSTSSYQQTTTTTTYGTPGKYDTNSSHSAYAAGAAAGLSASGYNNQQNTTYDQSAYDAASPRSPEPQQYHSHAEHEHFHEHKGPLARLQDGFFDLISSREDTAKMELYTQYIGVCKYCFDPRTSAWDAPRVHHHGRKRESYEDLRRRRSTDKMRRQGSSEMLRRSDSSRVDKDNRYYASESSRQRRQSGRNDLIAAGLAAAGVAAGAEVLSHRNDDIRTTKLERRESSVRRRSRSSSREMQRRSSHGPSRHDGPHEYVTVRTKDGRVERRRVRRNSRSVSRDRRSSHGVGLGTAAALALGAATVGASVRHRSRSDERRSPRRVIRRQSSRRESSSSEEGFFGSFFSPPRKERRDSRREHKKKRRGFFTFSNGSSSSTHSDLAFGGEGLIARPESSLRRKSSGRVKRKSSDERIAATVAGIGATAAALAAAQRGQRISKRNSRPELGARKEVVQHHSGPNHRHGSPGSSDEDWEDELPSDVDDASSIDHALAFGDHVRPSRARRGSRTSLNSQSSNDDLSAWGWRWGGPERKKRKDQYPDRYDNRPDNAYPQQADVTRPLRPGEFVQRDDTGRPLPSSNTSFASQTQKPMQTVDPRPLSEQNINSGSRLPSMPGAFDQDDIAIGRPGPGPIQQPQPILPRQAAFTQSPPAMDDTRPFRAPRRSNSSPVSGSFAQNAAIIGGAAALATAGIIAGANNRRGKDSSSVRFGLTEEQQRKADRDRADEEKRLAEERRRADRMRAVKEEAERTARESRAEEDRRAREDERRRVEEERLRREEAEARAAAEEKLRLARLERDRIDAERVAEEERRRQRQREAEDKERERRRREDEYHREQARIAEESRRRELQQEEQRREDERRRESDKRRDEERRREEERRRDDERRRDEEKRRDIERRRVEDEQSRSSSRRDDDSQRSDRDKGKSGSAWGAVAGIAAGATVGAVLAGRAHQSTEERMGKRDAPVNGMSRVSEYANGDRYSDEDARKTSERRAPSDVNHEDDRSYDRYRNVETATVEIKPPSRDTSAAVQEHELNDPDFFSKPRRTSRSTSRDRYDDLARKAAEKVMDSYTADDIIAERQSAYDDKTSQAAFFAPDDISKDTSAEKVKKIEGPPPHHADNEIQVYQARDPVIPAHFPPAKYDTRLTSNRYAPYGVPGLFVSSPTPPPPERRTGPRVEPEAPRESKEQERGPEAKKQSRPAPVSRVQTLDDDAPSDDELVTGGKTERSRSISWGEDQTHVYDEQTPDYRDWDSYMQGSDAYSSKPKDVDHDHVVVEDADGWQTKHRGDDYTRSSAMVEEVEDEDHPTRTVFFDPSFVGLPVDSPGTEGAPPVRGFVEGETDEPTPAEEKAPHIPGGFDDEVEDAKPKIHEKQSATKSAIDQEDAIIESTHVEPIVEEEPAWEPPLSKKEKKKRERAKRASSQFDDDWTQSETATPDEGSVPSVEPEDEPAEYFMSKKDKKKRDKAAKRASRDVPESPIGEREQEAELETPVAVPEPEVEVQKSSKKEQRALDKKGKKTGGLADIAAAVLSTAGVAAVAAAAESNEDSSSSSGKKAKGKKGKKKLGEPLERDIRDVEPVVEPEQSEAASHIPGSWDDDVATPAKEAGIDPAVMDPFQYQVFDDEDEDKRKNKSHSDDAEARTRDSPDRPQSTAKRASGVFNAPTVGSPLRSEVAYDDYVGRLKDDKNGSKINGNDDRESDRDDRRDDTNVSKRSSRSYDDDDFEDAKENGSPNGQDRRNGHKHSHERYGDDFEEPAYEYDTQSVAATDPGVSRDRHRRKRRSVREDDDTASVTSSRSRRERDESPSKKDKKGGLRSLFSRKSSESTTRSDPGRDSDDKRRERRRRDTYDDYDDERPRSENGERHHRRRRTDEDVSRSSTDKSFLGNRVEDLPPLPDSAPTSPTLTTRKQEQDIGIPVLVGLGAGAVKLMSDAARDGQKTSTSPDRSRSKSMSDLGEMRTNIPDSELPPLPLSRPESPTALTLETPARPGLQARPTSNTAVPLRFNMRGSPLTPGEKSRARAASFNAAASPATPVSPMAQQKPKQGGRPSSTEIREYRPLYLVERNSKLPEDQVSLPSLPSSKPSSRASSVHGSDEYESAAEEWSSPGHHRGLSIDTARANEHARQHGEYLNSEEDTPKASEFSQTLPETPPRTEAAPQNDVPRKASPQFYTWEDYAREEQMHEEESKAKEQSLAEPAVQDTPRSRSASPSKLDRGEIKGIAAAAMLGTAAVYADHALRSPEHSKLVSSAKERSRESSPAGFERAGPLPAPVAQERNTDNDQDRKLGREADLAADTDSTEAGIREQIAPPFNLGAFVDSPADDTESTEAESSSQAVATTKQSGKKSKKSKKKSKSQKSIDSVIHIPSTIQDDLSRTTTDDFLAEEARAKDGEVAHASSDIPHAVVSRPHTPVNQFISTHHLSLAHSPVESRDGTERFFDAEQDMEEGHPPGLVDPIPAEEAAVEKTSGQALGTASPQSVATEVLQPLSEQPLDEVENFFDNEERMEAGAASHADDDVDKSASADAEVPSKHFASDIDRFLDTEDAMEEGGVSSADMPSEVTTVAGDDQIAFTQPIDDAHQFLRNEELAEEGTTRIASAESSKNLGLREDAGLRAQTRMQATEMGVPKAGEEISEAEPSAIEPEPLSQQDDEFVAPKLSRKQSKKAKKQSKKKQTADEVLPWDEEPVSEERNINSLDVLPEDQHATQSESVLAKDVTLNDSARDTPDAPLQFDVTAFHDVAHSQNAVWHDAQSKHFEDAMSQSSALPSPTLVDDEVAKDKIDSDRAIGAQSSFLPASVENKGTVAEPEGDGIWSATPISRKKSKKDKKKRETMSWADADSSSLPESRDEPDIEPSEASSGRAAEAMFLAAGAATAATIATSVALSEHDRAEPEVVKEQEPVVEFAPVSSKRSKKDKKKSKRQSVSWAEPEEETSSGIETAESQDTGGEKAAALPKPFEGERHEIVEKSVDNTNAPQVANLELSDIPSPAIEDQGNPSEPPQDAAAIDDFAPSSTKKSKKDKKKNKRQSYAWDDSEGVSASNPEPSEARDTTQGENVTQLQPTESESVDVAEEAGDIGRISSPVDFNASEDPEPLITDQSKSDEVVSVAAPVEDFAPVSTKKSKKDKKNKKRQSLAWAEAEEETSSSAELPEALKPAVLEPTNAVNEIDISNSRDATLDKAESDGHPPTAIYMDTPATATRFSEQDRDLTAKPVTEADPVEEFAPVSSKKSKKDKKKSKRQSLSWAEPEEDSTATSADQSEAPRDLPVVEEISDSTGVLEHGVPPVEKPEISEIPPFEAIKDASESTNEVQQPSMPAIDSDANATDPAKNEEDAFWTPPSRKNKNKKNKAKRASVVDTAVSGEQEHKTADTPDDVTKQISEDKQTDTQITSTHVIAQESDVREPSRGEEDKPIDDVEFKHHRSLSPEPAHVHEPAQEATHISKSAFDETQAEAMALPLPSADREFETELHEAHDDKSLQYGQPITSHSHESQDEALNVPLPDDDAHSDNDIVEAATEHFVPDSPKHLNNQPGGNFITLTEDEPSEQDKAQSVAQAEAEASQSPSSPRDADADPETSSRLHTNDEIFEDARDIPKQPASELHSRDRGDAAVVHEGHPNAPLPLLAASDELTGSDEAKSYVTAQRENSEEDVRKSRADGTSTDEQAFRGIGPTVLPQAAEDEADAWQPTSKKNRKGKKAKQATRALSSSYDIESSDSPRDDESQSTQPALEPVAHASTAELDMSTSHEEPTDIIMDEASETVKDLADTIGKPIPEESSERISEKAPDEDEFSFSSKKKGKKGKKGRMSIVEPTLTEDSEQIEAFIPTLEVLPLAEATDSVPTEKDAPDTEPLDEWAMTSFKKKKKSGKKDRRDQDEPSEAAAKPDIDLNTFASASVPIVAAAATAEALDDWSTSSTSKKKGKKSKRNQSISQEPVEPPVEESTNIAEDIAKKPILQDVGETLEDAEFQSFGREISLEHEAVVTPSVETDVATADLADEWTLPPVKTKKGKKNKRNQPVFDFGNTESEEVAAAPSETVEESSRSAVVPEFSSQDQTDEWATTSSKKKKSKKNKSISVDDYVSQENAPTKNDTTFEDESLPTHGPDELGEVMDNSGAEREAISAVSVPVLETQDLDKDESAQAVSDNTTTSGSADVADQYVTTGKKGKKNKNNKQKFFAFDPNESEKAEVATALPDEIVAGKAEREVQDVMPAASQDEKNVTGNDEQAPRPVDFEDAFSASETRPHDMLPHAEMTSAIAERAVPEDSALSGQSLEHSSELRSHDAQHESVAENVTHAGTELTTHEDAEHHKASKITDQAQHGFAPEAQNDTARQAQIVAEDIGQPETSVEPQPEEFTLTSKKSKKDKKKAKKERTRTFDVEDDETSASTGPEQMTKEGIVPTAAVLAAAAIAAVSTVAAKEPGDLSPPEPEQKEATEDTWTSQPPKKSKKKNKKSINAIEQVDPVVQHTDIPTTSHEIEHIPESLTKLSGQAGHESDREVDLVNEYSDGQAERRDTTAHEGQHDTSILHQEVPASNALTIPKDDSETFQPLSRSATAELAVIDDYQHAEHEHRNEQPSLERHGDVPDAWDASPSLEAQSQHHEEDTAMADVAAGATNLESVPGNDQEAHETAHLHESSEITKQHQRDTADNDDIDFAATLAAGLEGSGFDPNMVINDPIFHRRASPPGAIAEADPEEVFQQTTSRRKKKDRRNVAQQASTDATNKAENVAMESSQDDIDAAISQGFEAAGFDPQLLESALASSNDERSKIVDDEPGSMISRKKGKKSKRSKATDESETSRAFDKPTVAPEADRELVVDDTMVDKVTEDPVSHTQAGTIGEGHFGLRGEGEMDIDEMDREYKAYKKNKRNAKKAKAAARLTAMQESANTSDAPRSADDTERSAVASEVEAMATPRKHDFIEPAAAVISASDNMDRPRDASPLGNDKASVSKTIGTVGSIFPGLERVKRKIPAAKQAQDTTDERRVSHSKSGPQGYLHTSEVSQSLPVALPGPSEGSVTSIDMDRHSSASSESRYRHVRDSPVGELERKPRSLGLLPGDIALMGAAAAAAATAAGVASASRHPSHERDRQQTRSREPADWSFDALTADESSKRLSPTTELAKHQVVRDSGYQEGGGSHRTSYADKHVQDKASVDSIKSQRSIERIHIPQSPASDWTIHVPKKRSEEGTRNISQQSRVSSEGTPLDPTSKNRVSYLFQSPPENSTTGVPSSAASTPSRTPKVHDPAHTIPRAISREQSPEFESTPIAFQSMNSAAHGPMSPRSPLHPIAEERHSLKRGIPSNEELGPEHFKALDRSNTPQTMTRQQHFSPTTPEVNLHSTGRTHHAEHYFDRHDHHQSSAHHGAATSPQTYERHTPSVASHRSVSSGSAFRGPEDLRSFSRASNRSNTPTLRRTSLSGDLRAASRRGETGSAVGAHSSPTTIPFEAPPTPPLLDDEEDVLHGRAARGLDMSDVFQGYGVAQGQNTSPTRPPGVRKRQSMHISELESRIDNLVAENRALQDARSPSGQLRSVSSSSENIRVVLKERDLQLQAKDNEINQLKLMLAPLQEQIAQLVEHNEGLTEANRSLVDDTNGRYSTLQSEHAHAHEQWQQASRELEATRAEHGRVTSNMRTVVDTEIANALADKNAEIRDLREQLDIAAEKIRALQTQIQSSKSGDYLDVRDEDYFDGTCQKLCQHVMQWVLRFSKMSDNRICRLSAEIDDERLEARLDSTILDGSDVDKLLSDRVRRRDVFTSLLMTMVWEYVFTRYLFGMDREQRQKLKTLEKTLSEVGPPRAVAQWRATTLFLLSKRPAFAQQCALDTEAVAGEIFGTLCTLLPPPTAAQEQLLASLQKVIRIAVDLSIEMRTQRAEYIMLPPLQPDYDSNGDLARKVHFNAQLMNEKSGQYNSNEELAASQAVVKIVLFPLVVKKGDDFGEGEEEVVVCPAQVLVHGDKGKKVVRMQSGAMDLDSPVRNRQSRMSMISEGSRSGW